MTLWTVAHQALLSLAFSRQESLNGLLFPTGIFLTQGSKPSSCPAGRFFTVWATREALLKRPQRTKNIEGDKGRAGLFLLPDSFCHLQSVYLCQTQFCVRCIHLLIKSALQHWEGATVIIHILQNSWLLAQSLLDNKRGTLSFGPSGSSVCAFHRHARPPFHDLLKLMMDDQGKITPPKVCSQSPVPQTVGPRIRSMPPGEWQYSPCPSYWDFSVSWNTSSQPMEPVFCAWCSRKPV